MISNIKYLFLIKLFLILITNNLQASCIQPSLNGNWKTNSGNISFVNTFTKNDGLPLKTRQGIEKFSFNNEKEW